MSDTGAGGKSSFDHRLLVLLATGLIIVLSRLVPEALPANPREELSERSGPIYCWLAGEGIDEGLYRIDPAFLEHSKKATAYGLSGLHFPPDADGSPPSALEIKIGQPVTAVLPPPELAPFFFAPIAVNRANRELLMTLPGIGPSLADAIIALRQRKGKLKEPHELLEAKGIGKTRMAKLSTQLVFD